MEEKLAIDIEVRLSGELNGGVPYALFAKTLDAVNAAAYASEQRDLRSIRAVLPELPAVATDAALERMRSHRGEATRITRAGSGSLIVYACVTGLAIFLLQQTVGETLKEAWKESPGHERVKEWLLKNVGRKTSALAADAQRRVQRATLSEVDLEEEPRRDPNQKSSRQRIRLTVTVRQEDDQYPPAREELF